MANTTSLESVKFGTGISEIPANAFKGCSLSEIVIPSNITTIGESAFENNKLTNVIIGCGTAEIGNNAFAYNNSIATINVTAVEPPVATDDVFSTQDAQLNVLKESREAYENAVCWYQFEGLDLVPVSVFKILNESVPGRAADANAKQLQFTVSVEPANASLKEYIFWESSNPEVATVDNNGLVTFTDATEGTAEITAKTLYDGVVASATVTAEGTLGIDGVIFDSNDGAADSVRPNDIYNLQGDMPQTQRLAGRHRRPRPRLLHHRRQESAREIRPLTRHPRQRQATAPHSGEAVAFQFVYPERDRALLNRKFHKLHKFRKFIFFS